MRVLTVPDVHLKPRIFTKARAAISKERPDAVVILGDLVDDWGKQGDVDLYHETLDEAERFAKETGAFFCYGNHDVSYLWGAPESGYNPFIRVEVAEHIRRFASSLPAQSVGFVHLVDGALFSHAGLTEEFVEDYLEDVKEDPAAVVEAVNAMGERHLWQENSPIWARPQYAHGARDPLYRNCTVQVVGHTPVENVTKKGALISVDTFSTYSDGAPIGDETFAITDTRTGRVEKVKSE